MPYLKINLQFFNGAEEKTEKATPKKRQKSREEGQVPKSQDVNTAFILLLVFLSLWFIGSLVGDKILLLLTHSFQEYMLLDLTEASLQAVFFELTMEIVVVVLPIMMVAIIAGVFSSYIQVGPLFSTKAIKPKLSKLDPIKGAKNKFFSPRILVELLKSLLKLTLTGILVTAMLWIDLESLMFLSQKSVADGFYHIAKLTVIMGIAVAILLMILSVPDYIYQKFDHEKQIRMSKKEVKDEHKNMEGDPKIKSKRRQKQMEMAMQRMMQEVPKADVVITNPTHFAVALRYDGDKMVAPVVVAKGVDYLAFKIRNIAKTNDVIIVENKPLARALYAQADIGDAVPEDLFKAVAEVLAYVYRLKNKEV